MANERSSWPQYRHRGPGRVLGHALLLPRPFCKNNLMSLTSDAMTALPKPAPIGEPRRPIPPLESGDQLSRAEFERRYHAMPEIKKAELIEGVVRMPSPVRWNHHGKPHFRFNT